MSDTLKSTMDEPKTAPYKHKEENDAARNTSSAHKADEGVDNNSTPPSVPIARPKQENGVPSLSIPRRRNAEVQAIVDEVIKSVDAKKLARATPNAAATTPKNQADSVEHNDSQPAQSTLSTNSADPSSTSSSDAPVNKSAPEDNDSDDGSTTETEEDDESPKPSAPRKQRSRLARGKKQEARWTEMYRRLLLFKQMHGHCLVPNRYELDPSLGAWVSTQRRQYKILMTGDYQKTTSITPERVELLESIGFAWATKDPRHVPWETRFMELVEYKKKHGDCMVPMDYKENIQLAHWVSAQRHEYKRRSKKLTLEKIIALNTIGFVWEAPRGARLKEDDLILSALEGHDDAIGRVVAASGLSNSVTGLPGDGAQLSQLRQEIPREELVQLAAASQQAAAPRQLNPLAKATGAQQEEAVLAQLIASIAEQRNLAQQRAIAADKEPRMGNTVATTRGLADLLHGTASVADARGVENGDQAPNDGGLPLAAVNMIANALTQQQTNSRVAQGRSLPAAAVRRPSAEALLLASLEKQVALQQLLFQQRQQQQQQQRDEIVAKHMIQALLKDNNIDLESKAACLSELIDRRNHALLSTAAHAQPTMAPPATPSLQATLNGLLRQEGPSGLPIKSLGQNSNPLLAAQQYLSEQKVLPAHGGLDVQTLSRLVNAAQQSRRRDEQQEVRDLLAALGATALQQNTELASRPLNAHQPPPKSTKAARPLLKKTPSHSGAGVVPILPKPPLDGSVAFPPQQQSSVASVLKQSSSLFGNKRRQPLDVGNSLPSSKKAKSVHFASHAVPETSASLSGPTKLGGDNDGGIFDDAEEDDETVSAFLASRTRRS